MPTFPFLFLPYVFLDERWRWPLVVLGVLSAVIQLVIVATNPLVGRFDNPLFQYWIPSLLTRQIRAALIVRQRYGIPYRFALLFVIVWMSLGPGLVWLWRHLRATWRDRFLKGAFALVLIVYMAAAFPLDFRHPTRVPDIYLLPSPPVRDNPPTLNSSP